MGKISRTDLLDAFRSSLAFLFSFVVLELGLLLNNTFPVMKTQNRGDAVDGES